MRSLQKTATVLVLVLALVVSVLTLTVGSASASSAGFFPDDVNVIDGPLACQDTVWNELSGERSVRVTSQMALIDPQPGETIVSVTMDVSSVQAGINISDLEVTNTLSTPNLTAQVIEAYPGQASAAFGVFADLDLPAPHVYTVTTRWTTTTGQVYIDSRSHNVSRPYIWTYALAGSFGNNVTNLADYPRPYPDGVNYPVNSTNQEIGLGDTLSVTASAFTCGGSQVVLARDPSTYALSFERAFIETSTVRSAAWDDAAPGGGENIETFFALSPTSVNQMTASITISQALLDPAGPYFGSGDIEAFNRWDFTVRRDGEVFDGPNDVPDFFGPVESGFIITQVGEFVPPVTETTLELGGGPLGEAVQLAAAQCVSGEPRYSVIVYLEGTEIPELRDAAPTGEPDIVLEYSTDGGTTWSSIDYTIDTPLGDRVGIAFIWEGSLQNFDLRASTRLGNTFELNDLPATVFRAGPLYQAPITVTLVEAAAGDTGAGDIIVDSNDRAEVIVEVRSCETGELTATEQSQFQATASDVTEPSTNVEVYGFDDSSFSPFASVTAELSLGIYQVTVSGLGYSLSTILRPNDTVNYNLLIAPPWGEPISTRRVYVRGESAGSAEHEEIIIAYLTTQPLTDNNGDVRPWVFGNEATYENLLLTIDAVLEDASLSAVDKIIETKRLLRLYESTYRDDFKDYRAPLLSNKKLDKSEYKADLEAFKLFDKQLRAFIESDFFLSAYDFSSGA